MSIDQTKFAELTDGLTYTAEFVPFSQAPHRDGGDGKRWQCVNWRVRLECGRVILEADYAQGIGCLPDTAKQSLSIKQVGRPGSLAHDAALTFMLENGREYGNTTRKLPPPSLPDVLSSLLLDASAIDYSTFEDWCDEYGDNPDSRKAEATYRQCVETGLKLRLMFGDTRLEELRELFADY